MNALKNTVVSKEKQAPLTNGTKFLFRGKVFEVIDEKLFNKFPTSHAIAYNFALQVENLVPKK